MPSEPSPNADTNQESEPVSTHLHLPAEADENSSSQPNTDHDNRNETTVATEEKNVFPHPQDADNVSVVANSTFSGYVPSSIGERKGLISGRHHYMSASRHPRKTKGRRAFVGVCQAVNVIMPIDIDHEVENMHASSIARLARAVKKKEDLFTSES